jgi:hypothetical protein
MSSKLFLHVEVGGLLTWLLRTAFPNSNLIVLVELGSVDVNVLLVVVVLSGTSV